MIKIVHHTNDTWIVETSSGRFTIRISWQRSLFGGCRDGGAELSRESECLYNALDKARLRKDSFVAITFNFESQVSFGSTFTTQLDSICY